jgi:hypothetical protein
MTSSARGPRLSASQLRIASPEVLLAASRPRSRIGLAMPMNGLPLVAANTALARRPSAKVNTPEPWICRKNRSSGRIHARAGPEEAFSMSARSG